MKTEIQRWQDLAQKGDTCTILLPIAQAEAEQLRAALLALKPQMEVTHWRASVPPDCNDIRRFIVIRDEIVHLRRELDAAHEEIARAA